jgi:hypothetical protein
VARETKIPQIQCDLTWTRTQAAKVGSRQLTTCSMAGHYFKLITVTNSSKGAGYSSIVPFTINLTCPDRALTEIKHRAVKKKSNEPQ